MSDYQCDDGYDDGSVPCPHCYGDGTVNCYCAGDFCICDNHGDATCYVCGGDGDVSEEREKRYLENQRKNAELMREIMAAAPSLSRIREAGE